MPNYREPIEDFETNEEKEYAVKNVVKAEESVFTKEIPFSVSSEEEKEIEVPINETPIPIKEQSYSEENITKEIPFSVSSEEEKEIEVPINETPIPIKEQSYSEENIKEVSPPLKQNYIDESIISEIEKDIKESIKEVSPPPELEVVEAVIPEQKKEEPLPQKSFQELIEELLSKVNPSNENRFKLYSLEETEESKDILDNVFIKLVFLSDDVEASVVSENQALLKLKELEKPSIF